MINCPNCSALMTRNSEEAATKKSPQVRKGQMQRFKAGAIGCCGLLFEGNECGSAWLALCPLSLNAQLNLLQRKMNPAPASISSFFFFLKFDADIG